MESNRDFNCIRIISILLIMLLISYPVCELTRCIIEYSIIPTLTAEKLGMEIVYNTGNLFPSFTPDINNFYLELSLIWSFFICIPLILDHSIKLAFLMGRSRQS